MNFLRFFLIAMLGFTVTACGRSQTYHYKLTLSVNTPEGVKTAFNVVEVTATESTYPIAGAGSHIKGEALYLDLGPGKRPLIALLTRKSPPNENPPPYLNTYVHKWSEQDPTMLIWRLNGGGVITSFVDTTRQVALFTTLRSIRTEELPDLVTFANVNDPKSMMIVDPDELNATLGQAVSWRSMTIEVTDESLTGGLESKLPWIIASNEVFPRQGTGSRNSYERVLTRLNFKR